MSLTASPGGAPATQLTKVVPIAVECRIDRISNIHPATIGEYTNNRYIGRNNFEREKDPRPKFLKFSGPSPVEVDEYTPSHPTAQLYIKKYRQSVGMFFYISTFITGNNIIKDLSESVKNCIYEYALDNEIHESKGLIEISDSVFIKNLSEKIPVSDQNYEMCSLVYKDLFDYLKDKVFHVDEFYIKKSTGKIIISLAK